jgi:hypothetical protein
MEDRDQPTAPAPLSSSADRAIRALYRMSGAPSLARIRGGDLLTERARLARLKFTHGISAGGSCHLLPSGDRFVAVSLPRESDWELVSAWLECDTDTWNWQSLAEAIRPRDSETLLERAHLLGIAIAAAVPPAPSPVPACLVRGAPLPTAEGRPTPQQERRPIVIDLSALWAGPLCAHLLHLCGADVIKVEAVDRPDGARQGNLPFYRLLNQGKRCVALDFHEPAGRRVLRKLLERADVVVESSRPRALRHMGIEPEALLENHPALTWVSITGYGREDPQANWIAFGDDAGVAAGLSDVMRAATGTFQFAGDAIADPLTGIRAALAAWQSWQAGGSRLLALSLAGVAAASLSNELEHVGETGVRQSFGAWWADVQGRQLGPRGPRPASDPVGTLGEHTDTVLAELAISC